MPNTIYYYSGLTQLLQYIEQSCFAYSSVTSASTIRVGHSELNSFGKGEVSDIAVKGDDLYPRAFLEYPIQVTFKGDHMFFDLALNIVDIEKQERTDEETKLDLCYDIGTDLIQKFRDEKIYTGYSLEPDSLNFLSLTEFSDDYTAGWRIEFQLKHLLKNKCEWQGNFQNYTPYTCINCTQSSGSNDGTCDCISYIFSGGSNLLVTTGGTNPQLVIYNLKDSINVSDINANEINSYGLSIAQRFEATEIDVTNCYSLQSQTNSAYTQYFTATTIGYINNLYNNYLSSQYIDVTELYGLGNFSFPHIDNLSGNINITNEVVLTSSINSLSASTINSGTTNLYQIFAPIGSVGSGGVSLAQLNTKVSKSGDTMTGQLNVPRLSATTLSASSINNYSSGGAGSGVNIFSTDSSLYSTMDWYNSSNDNAQMLMAGAGFSSGIFNSRSASFNCGGLGGLNIVAYHSTGGVIRFATGGVAAANERMRIEAGGIVRAGSLSATTLTGGTIYSGASELSTILIPQSYFRASAATPSMFTGTPFKCNITFSSTMNDANYIVQITGGDARTWSWENKTANGFTINSNSFTTLTANTDWIVYKFK